MMNKDMFSEMNYQDIDDNRLISSIQLFDDDKNEKSFRIT